MTVTSNGQPSKAWKLKVGLAALALLSASCAAALVWLNQVVCVPIPDSDLVNFSSPLEARTEQAKPGVKMFQLRDGRWDQCKTRLDRIGFM